MVARPGQMSVGFTTDRELARVWSGSWLSAHCVSVRGWSQRSAARLLWIATARHSSFAETFAAPSAGGGLGGQSTGYQHECGLWLNSGRSGSTVNGDSIAQRPVPVRNACTFSRKLSRSHRWKREAPRQGKVHRTTHKPRPEPRRKTDQAVRRILIEAGPIRIRQSPTLRMRPPVLHKLGLRSVQEAFNCRHSNSSRSSTGLATRLPHAPAVCRVYARGG